jgi:hypothetical protein
MFKVSKPKPKKEGILYILIMEVEGDTLVKIGVTSRKVEDRVQEILVSIWKKYRYFPWCYIKRYKKVGGHLDKEARLHKIFEEYRYPLEKVSGGTEFFKVNPEHIVNTYEAMVKGTLVAEGKEDEIEECPICGKAKKFTVRDEDRSIRLSCGHDCERKDV